MSVTAEDFTFLADLLRQESAISIATGKEYLVESRLTPVARAAGMADVTELIGVLRKPFADRAVKEQVIEAMTTNETSFFRDRHPFDAMLSDVIPEVMERKAITRRLSIWSAASSTGQELYSLAMLLDGNFPDLQTWDVQLHGTDLSNEVLKKARNGRFSTLEVNRGLPAALMAKYFHRDGADYVIEERLRKQCRFEQLNLAEPWPLHVPQFDIVFCRNVLIYFELDVRRQILERIRQRLPKGGYLFLGTSETTVGLCDGYTAVRCGQAVAYRVED